MDGGGERRFQSWLIATYGGNATRFAALEVSDFDQDIGVLNDDVEAIAREIDPSLVTYEPFEAPAAMDDFEAFAVSEPFEYDAHAPAATEAPDVAVFTPSRGASFGTYRAFTPSKAYPTYAPFALPSGAYPGFVAHVPAAPFPAALLAESLAAAAADVRGVREGGDVTDVHPVRAGGWAVSRVRAVRCRGVGLPEAHARAVPAVLRLHSGAVSRLHALRDGAGVFAHAVRAPARARLRAVRVARAEPPPRWWSDRYDRYWMRDPKHIDKHDMTKLFYYHKAWYYQEYSICRPTCVGTMGPNTDVDTDPLAPDRV